MIGKFVYRGIRSIEWSTGGDEFGGVRWEKVRRLSSDFAVSNGDLLVSKEDFWFDSNGKGDSLIISIKRKQMRH